MPVESFPWSIQGQSHPATVARNMTAGLLGAPAAALAAGSLITTAGGSHGVVGAGDLAVSQNGTPNMSVNVAAGRAFIRGTETGSLNQGVYSFFNDAVVNLVVAAADPTNPRRDLVVAQVRDANYSGAANDARLFVVTGTPAASPVDPTVPNSCVVLARVAVAALAASITNANITDLRTRASSLGGTQVCTSTTRPTGSSLYNGLEVWETDTQRLLRYDGTGWIIMAEPELSYTPTLTNMTLGNGDRTSGSSYHRSDGYCDFTARFILGSTSAMGTGPQFSIPVLPSTGIELDVTGTALVYDASTGDRFIGPLVYVGSSTVTATCTNTAGTYLVAASIQATVPITWTTSDQLVVAGRYRMTTRYS